MNALFELIGTTLRGFEYDALIAEDPHLFDNCKVERTQISRTPDPNFDRIKIFPSVETSAAKVFVQSIKFAKVYKDDGWSDDEETIQSASLRSDRTKEDELKFLNDLAAIDYDDGYGSQELFGIIVFKDGTWLQRHEYDGSEHWERMAIPEEDEYFK